MGTGNLDFLLSITCDLNEIRIFKTLTFKNDCLLATKRVLNQNRSPFMICIDDDIDILQSVALIGSELKKGLKKL